MGCIDEQATDGWREDALHDDDCVNFEVVWGRFVETDGDGGSPPSPGNARTDEAPKSSPEGRGGNKMKQQQIQIYAVTETEGGKERTRYQYSPATPDSTYGYNPLTGERIGAILERGIPVLAGHFVPAPGVAAELAEAKGGVTLLYLDGVGYEAHQVVEGAPAMDGKGHYTGVSR